MLGVWCLRADCIRINAFCFGLILNWILFVSVLLLWVSCSIWFLFDELILSSTRYTLGLYFCNTVN